MKKNAGLWKYLLSSIFLMVLCVSNALAYDVSGNVSASSGGKRVFLQIDTPNGRLGTSIASAPGTYTIRGVPAGTNNAVVAFVDTLDTGSRHYSDPYGSSGVFAITNSNYTTADIAAFKSAAALSTVSPPSGLTVLPSSSTDAIVMWKSSNNGQGELADSYKLYWSTSSNVAGSSSVSYIPATGDMRGYMFHNMSGSTPMYFAITSTVSGVESAMSPVVGPISFTSATGYNVSGTVTLPGTISIPPTIPMMIGIVVETPDGPPSAMYSTIVPGPLTSSVPYTVPNVPNGTYRVYALIDINQNGSIDNGDLNASDSEAPSITVNNGDVTTANLTLAGSNSQAFVRTEHYKNGASEGYSINFDIERQSKLPVKVTFQGGPGVAGPIDIALSDWGRFEGRASLGSRPNVNDTYSFDVTYSDGSSETISGKITAVVDSFASLTAPLGTITYNAAPTFSWSAPTSPVPPVGYTYQLGVREQTGMLDWYTKWFPNSTTSMIYNSDNSAGQTSLIDGKTYDWNVSVLDADGNSASNHATFSFASGGTAIAITTTGFTSPNVNTFFSQTLNATGGSGSYTWSVQTGTLPAGLTLSSGGVLSGTPTAIGMTNFTVLAADAVNSSNTATMSYSFNVLMAGTALSVATTNLPDAQVNSVYGQMLNVTGGTPSYSFTLYSGSLPNGMTLNGSTGSLSGTPTVPGTYAFTVQVQDQIFATAFANLTLNVVGSTTVSGTVSYSGSKNGRIYIYARTNNGLTVGTSISAPGAYSIQGVPAGSYTLSSFMDPPGLGAQVHNSPTGSVTFSTSTPGSVNITLADPSTLLAGQPTNIGAAAGDASILMGWDGAKDSNGLKTADSYKVYWHTNSSVSKLNNLGSKTVPAELDSPVMISGLTNGTAYYFVVVPSADGVDGIASAVYGPVTIGAPAGGYTVSGTVNYTGAFSAGGVMYVVIVKPDSKGVGAAYYTKIASPAATNSFTVSGVPDGTYEVFALYDSNNDGLFAIGDIMPKDESAPLITIAGSAVSAGTISLVSANADVTITTQHGKQAGNSSEWYNVNGNFRGQLLRPVAVKLTNAPASSGISTPVDIGLDGREIRFWSNVSNPPAVGDVYTFTVYFADGSSQVFSPVVTGVLGNNSFATNPTVTGSSTVPTFSWAAPVTPPANYKYSIWVGINNSNYWDAWALPSTLTSVVYGFDGSASALQTNTQYNWNISVRDLNGNEASVNGTYTPTVAVASISGTVKTTGGAGISGALVNVYNSTGAQVASATADANGNYTVTGLATGTYRLLFSAANYINQYFSNKTTLALADPVSVVLGTPTANVNCTLVLGGKITGTVTDAALTGINGVSVQYYNAVTGSQISGTTTDASGNYTISGLSAGVYKVRFVPASTSGLVSLWYNGKTVNSVWTADQVTVAAEGTTSGINAVLTMGGNISGTVTDSSSVGISGASVSVYDAVTNSFINSATTASDGTYTVSGLPTGECKVSFYAASSGYISKIYNITGNSLNVATIVPVTAGSTVTGINASLTMGGKISGTVTSSATSAGISGISVTAVDAATNMNVMNTTTASNGTYTVSGLPAGNYKVRFNDTNSSNGYVAVWNTNKTSIAAADSVAVTVGATTSGINASLASGGSISGQVTDGTNGAANITVSAYNALDETVATTTTNATGSYTVKGLPSGSYKLRFQEMQNSTYVPVGYVPQVYTNPNINVTYLSQATPVAVVVGTPVTGINAVLVKDAGSISGTVTDVSNGLPVAGATVRVTDLSGGTYNSATTDASGNYVVKGLPTGSYKVEYFMYGKYAQQWYSAAGDFISAATVAVTAPAATTSINAALGTGQSIYLPAVIKGFGTVNVASTSTRTLQIYNAGSASLTVGTLSIAGADFTLLNDLCSGKTLLPISFCTIQVSFTPGSVGAKTATVTIPSNDAETPAIGITVKGTGASSETVPPTIVSITPANNATNVSINTVLTVKFSEAIDQGTLPVETAFLKTAAGVYIAGAGSYDLATNTGTFTPLASLAYNTTYTGTFSGIKDLSGNVLATAFTFTFTTGANPDATAPSVIQSVPLNNAQNVSVDSALTVKFSEPVKAATVQSTLILRAGSAVVSGAVTYDAATNTATFTPAAPLAMGATYSLSVGNTIEDLAGNKLNSLTIFFTTEVPSGDIDGSSSVDIGDAYKLLEIAVGNVTATPQDLKNADIAPLINGKPKPDGVIDVADVVVILRRIVGLVTW